MATIGTFAWSGLGLWNSVSKAFLFYCSKECLKPNQVWQENRSRKQNPSPESWRVSIKRVKVIFRRPSYSMVTCTWLLLWKQTAQSFLLRHKRHWERTNSMRLCLSVCEIVSEAFLSTSDRNHPNTSNKCGVAFPHQSEKTSQTHWSTNVA